jgi:hypothetical protein
MVSMIIDSQQQSKLNEASGPVHLVNEAGQIVRVALTPEEFLRYLHKTVEVPISQEEIERRSKNGGGRTLDEIWKRLGAK